LRYYRFAESGRSMHFSRVLQGCRATLVVARVARLTHHVADNGATTRVAPTSSSGRLTMLRSFQLGWSKRPGETDTCVGPLRRLHLLEGLAGDAEGVDAARDARVDRDLSQHFTNFVLGDAVAQRAFDMQLQFVRPVQDADHRDVEHAAGL